MTRLLVIDDSRDIREAASDLLGDQFELRVVENGQVALDLLRQGYRPGFILCDLIMPVLDGFKFCRQVKADPQLQNIPVYLFSVETGIEKITQDLGAQGFIRKDAENAYDLVLELGVAAKAA